MHAVTHDTGIAYRLLLASLLTLLLHAALLFLSMSVDLFSFHPAEAQRFEVVLLPPSIQKSEQKKSVTAAEKIVPVPKISPATSLKPQSKPAVESVAKVKTETKPVIPPPSITKRVAPAVPASTKTEATPSLPPKSKKIATPQKKPVRKSIKKPKKSTKKPTRRASQKTAKKPARKTASAVKKPPEKSRTRTKPVKKPAKKSVGKASARKKAKTTISKRRTSSSRPLNSAALLGQIASIEAKNQQQKKARRTRVKRANPRDTSSMEGFYAAAWVRKIERIGTMNFPAVARRLNLQTGPTLEVSINANGSLKQIRVVRSSGNAQLDQAAKRIVQLGAPYAPFPSALRQRYDVLKISRPWRFDPGGQVRAR